jgi:hypothetical protein
LMSQLLLLPSLPLPLPHPLPVSPSSALTYSDQLSIQKVDCSGELREINK